MTRYLEPYELLAMCESSSSQEAHEVARVLDPGGVELIPVHATEASGMLPTYEVRLARWSAGDGPETSGLEHFVDVLRSGGRVELFGVRRGRRTWIGLIDRNGALVAVTAVRPPGDRGGEPRTH